MWDSGDYDGLQSQRSGVQIQVSAKKKKKKKKNWGVRSKVRVRVVNGTRVRDAGLDDCMVRGSIGLVAGWRI